MNKLREKLIKEILDVTGILQRRYPEVYAHLMEDRVFVSCKKKVIGNPDYKLYPDSLKSPLKGLSKKKV